MDEFKATSGGKYRNIIVMLTDGESDVQLDVGKLAIWRLRTREDFGSTWLSDYVENSLGGYIQEQSETEDFEMEMM